MNGRRFGIGFVCLGMAIIALAAGQGMGQSGQAATDKKKPLELQEILSKLTFTSRINHSFEELNNQLVVAVQNRGVNFIVSDENRQAIRKAGGNDALVKAIDLADVPPEVKLLDEERRLYQIVLENYKSKDIERLKKAIEAAKDILRISEDYRQDTPIVDWLRRKIPEWENRLPGRY